MDNRTEARQLKALRAGDTAALEWLMDTYTAYVATIVDNILGDVLSRSDVEECTADVFVSAWKNGEKLRDGHVKGWLAAVARNTARSRLRKHRQTATLEDNAAILTAEDPERLLQRQELYRLMREALEQLPEPDREIFLRHYYYYQTTAEIACELGMPVSTVTTKLARGRAKLREHFRKGGYSLEDPYI